MFPTVSSNEMSYNQTILTLYFQLNVFKLYKSVHLSFYYYRIILEKI